MEEKCKVKMQFDPAVAKEIGVEEAIMLSNIEFWCEHNKANKKNFFDGYYWTYNSVSAFKALFTFWSEMQIRRILKKLEDKKYIKVGEYNKTKYDRTKWYTSTCSNKKAHLVKPTNRVSETNEPIPDNKPDNKPDNIDIEKSNFNKNLSSLIDKKFLLEEKTTKFISTLNSALEGIELNEETSAELKSFISYWTEPNRSKTKLKWELERTWDTKRRFYTWVKNSKKWGNQKRKEVLDLYE